MPIQLNQPTNQPDSCEKLAINKIIKFDHIGELVEGCLENLRHSCNIPVISLSKKQVRLKTTIQPDLMILLR